MIEFATLSPPNSQNFYIVCPEGQCPSDVAHGVPPMFPVPPAVLREYWLKVLSREPRMTMESWNDDLLECEFVQRSTVFKFPDRISVKFYAGDGGSSTLAIYGRSVFGRYDFGANKRRIERWLSSLRREVEQSASQGARG